MYWAEELAKQTTDIELQNAFKVIAQELISNEKAIVEELNNAQGSEIELEGYYFPTDELAAKAMRPSKILNDILANLN